MAYEDEEKKQYMVIKIKKPHHAERLAWIALVAFLLTVIIYQWMAWPDEVVYSPVEQATEGTATPEEVEKEGNAPEAVPTEVQEEKKTEEATLSGRLEVAITKVTVEKKGIDFGKVLSVAYSVDNQEKDFVPLVRFFLYDSQWTEELYSPGLISRCCEQQPLLNLPLKVGAPKFEKTFYPNNGNGFSVSNLTETKKTIKMEVYDTDDLTKLLAATEYTLKSDMWK